MKGVYSPSLVPITWLMTAILYWTYSHCAPSHTLWQCHVQSSFCSIDTHNLEISKRLEWYEVNELNKTFLSASAPQSPFIHKWKGVWSRSKRKTPKHTIMK